MCRPQSLPLVDLRQRLRHLQHLPSLTGHHVVVVFSAAIVFLVVPLRHVTEQVAPDVEQPGGDPAPLADQPLEPLATMVLILVAEAMR